MPELQLKSIDDVKKLEGWTIQKAEITTGADVVLTLQITHPAAACPVKLAITSIPQFGRSGNVMVCNGTMTLKAENTE